MSDRTVANTSRHLHEHPVNPSSDSEICIAAAIDQGPNKLDHDARFLSVGRSVTPSRKLFHLLVIVSVCVLAGLALSLVAVHYLRPTPIPAPVSEAPPPPVVPLPAPEPEPEPEPALPPKPMEEEPAPPPVQEPARLPAWQANAVPARSGPAMIAVIIDDMGVDRRRSAKVVDLPGPLTLSYMTYASRLAEQAASARAHGHELMMHVPMQPLGANDPGPDVLSEDLPPEELRRRIETDLDRFQGYVGINNHMGSKFTAYAPGMRLVMEALRRRGLLFIDSMTTGNSVGLASAREAQVPAAARNIFLDDIDDEAAVTAQLAKAEEQAKKKGSVIVIGHPHDNTVAALAAWLPGLAERGVTLVPVTAVVKSRPVTVQK